jgi:hypothetical protein
MPAKEAKTAAELKVLIENELRKDHPECAYADVVINPPAGLSPWSASIYGEGPAIAQNCRSRIDNIVAQMRERFDLAPQHLGARPDSRERLRSGRNCCGYCFHRGREAATGPLGENVLGPGDLPNLYGGLQTGVL